MSPAPQSRVSQFPVPQSQAEGRYLLSITPIPPTEAASIAVPGASPLPAYFVGSTAPNNVETGVKPVPNPEPAIKEIAQFLSEQERPELLIAIHGYNTPLGAYATANQPGRGAQGWYQNIRDHISQHCPNRSNGLMLVGYRWPSEEINGVGNDTRGAKINYAQASLPVALRLVLVLAIAALVALTLLALTTDLPGSVVFGIVGVGTIVLATLLLSVVLTLFLLRLAGYFRDSYRANHFGVPDLVEFIRQLDKAAVEINPDSDWSKRRIKLSFIGHSMGGFVVTNTVRILSDVFDTNSIGHTNLNAGRAKCPSANLGNVFSLGRLVLVSPDIPAETIISSRANFLSSSLRRFDETYLFSNEGDMALKLASTAANYASFPARTREGGYRLGNVVVRSPKGAEKRPKYGIVNLDSSGDTLKLLDMTRSGAGDGVEPKMVETPSNDSAKASSFLSYLYVLPNKSLLERQDDVLDIEQRPIAELFTIFDCTDYSELGPGGDPVGLLSHALKTRSLSFWSYVSLTYDYFTGKIDTHGGYFASGNVTDVGPDQGRPDAQTTKQLIYGLACLGFRPLLDSLGGPSLKPASEETDAESSLRALSEVCDNHGIQVMLAAERYNNYVLDLESDRTGY
ncbi:MAG: alpha/beta hydrolase [Elainellaceae cyanobacterium]